MLVSACLSWSSLAWQQRFFPLLVCAPSAVESSSSDSESGAGQTRLVAECTGAGRGRQEHGRRWVLLKSGQHAVNWGAVHVVFVAVHTLKIVVHNVMQVATNLEQCLFLTCFNFDLHH
jgi:hypothetical protein